jgi:hypothetical protein
MLKEKETTRSKIWDTHALPKRSNCYYSKILPICPKPLEGESLYSWLVRVSKKNFGLIKTVFEKDGFIINYPRGFDNSWNETFLKSVIEKTGLTEEDLKQLHTSKWHSLFGESLIKSNMLFSKKIKVCPLCLRENPIKFFKLEYRLNLLNACLKHNCFIIDGCPNCNAEIKPHHLPYNKPFYRCYKCNSDLRKTDPVIISENIDRENAEYQIRDILKSKTSKLMNKLNTSPDEFFETIIFLCSFLVKINLSTISIKSNLGLKLKLLNNFKRKNLLTILQNPIITYNLTNISLYLLANEKDLEKIIKDNQGIFNKIIKSNKLIPKFILKYRKTKKLTPTPEKKEIIDAIKHFKKEGIPINNKSIADFCGFNAYILNHASNKELNTLIDQHRTQDNLIEEKIIETIEKFKKDGKKATITKVAKNVGVLPSVIYNNPDLSKHFEIDRKIDITYIPRIKSAIEEIKLKKNRLTISEVARRADICRRVIYKYPILKQTIDKAIQD